MRRLFFTDFHLKKERLKEQRIVLKKIIDLCLAKNIKSIIFLGDMFNDRKSVTPYELHLFKWFIRQCVINEITFDAIAGNHDKPFNESEKSYLSIFENELKGIKVYEDKNLLVKDKFLFIPYFPEKDIVEMIKYVKGKDKVQYIFMHNAFDGALANSGKKMSSKLTINSFKKFINLRKIFVGHYHEMNELAGRKIFYIGNTMQLNFGEKDNKGVYEFNDVTGETIFYPMDYPKFLTFRFSCNLENYQKCFKIVKENIDNYVRIIFVGEKKQILSIPKKVIERKSKCKYLRIDENVLGEENMEENLEVDFGKDMVKSFLKYSRQEKMNNEEMKFGIKILMKKMENINA